MIEVQKEWIAWMQEGINKIEYGTVCFKFIIKDKQVIRFVRNFEESKKMEDKKK